MGARKCFSLQLAKDGQIRTYCTVHTVYVVYGVQYCISYVCTISIVYDCICIHMQSGSHGFAILYCICDGATVIVRLLYSMYISYCTVDAIHRIIRVINYYFAAWPNA